MRFIPPSRSPLPTEQPEILSRLPGEARESTVARCGAARIFVPYRIRFEKLQRGNERGYARMILRPRGASVPAMRGDISNYFYLIEDGEENRGASSREASLSLSLSRSSNAKACDPHTSRNNFPWVHPVGDTSARESDSHYSRRRLTRDCARTRSTTRADSTCRVPQSQSKMHPARKSQGIVRPFFFLPYTRALSERIIRV